MIKASENFDGMTATICTTFDCNLRCTYCYELNKRAICIDEKTIYKFIDILLTETDITGLNGTKDAWIQNTGLILDFIGGDSFMQPDLIDKTLEYFIYKSTMMKHPYAKKWRASISTNGTLFGDPKVQKLIEKYKENFSIGVSIDGCPEIHDMNRIFTVRQKNGKPLGTMSTIMKWWPWLSEVSPEAVNVTKSTCSKNSIPWLYKSLKFMHTPYPNGLGITYINQNFIMEKNGCEEDDYVILDEQYRKCHKYLWKHKHEMYWSMFDINGLNKRSDSIVDFNHSITKGWCGSGSMPSLGLNGKIYPCFRWLPHTMDKIDDANTMCVGNVESGMINKEAFSIVRRSDRRAISSEYCLECEYESSCAYCIGGCYAEFHEFKRTEHICYINKLRHKWARRYWDLLEEHEHPGYDYLKTLPTNMGYIINDADHKDYRRYWGDDGKLKPEFRTPDNPTGEPLLTIKDLPEEYRDAWKYRPTTVVKEGEEINEDDNLPINNVGQTSIH